MSKTKISDVIVPEVFNPYVVERTAELSALFQSGIVQRSSELDRLAESGGKLLNMPFWEDLDGADEVLRDDEALGVGKIEAGQDVAALLMRGKAWSVNDLAKALSGDDPMAAVGDLVANYWARRMQAVVLATLKGIYAGTGMSDNELDISGEGGTDANITGENSIDAVYKLGDAQDKLTGWLMHSAVVAKLRKLDLIDYVQPSEVDAVMATFQGKRVVIDDGLPTSGSGSDKIFETYIFGQGAFGQGEGSAPTPTETDRDSLAGDDILINRRHFILHPRGVKYKDEEVEANHPSPTNNNLEHGDNWERVYEPKNVRIVRFKHKLNAE